MSSINVSGQSKVQVGALGLKALFRGITFWRVVEVQDVFFSFLFFTHLSAFIPRENSLESHSFSMENPKVPNTGLQEKDIKEHEEASRAAETLIYMQHANLL